MSNEKHPSPTERLAEAYDRMMERVSASLEEAEEKARPTLQKHLDRAVDKTVELEELTREEAEKVAAWVRRDLRDAGHHLAETGEELGHWLKFDIELMEQRLYEFLARAADKTKLEILELRETLQADPPHHSGEITGPGTLYCSDCGQAMHFHRTGHIPPCPKCHGSNFRRAPVKR
jgi:hypothetical protein